jgi:hypothetical protein
MGVDERVNSSVTQPARQAFTVFHGFDAVCGKPVMIRRTHDANHLRPARLAN